MWWLLLLLLPTTLFGQIELSGSVFDETNDSPLIGATIRVRETTRGVMTDENGRFRITVPNQESILIVSYIGFEQQEILVGNQSSIDVRLMPKDAVVDEVVVVGYTTQKKQNLTGAISSVSADDLKEANATSLTRALQGRLAGVNISSVSGNPGAGLSITVRGPGSVAGNSQPLVIIDGIISTAGALASINPQDIESVSLLKDAASASIYGARSSAGVILVTTKNGGEGPLRINYNSQVGLAVLPRQMDLMNADEYRAFYREVYAQHNETYPNDPRRLPAAYTDSAWVANGSTDNDWQSLISNTPALRQQHYVSFAGGSKSSTFMFSTAYVAEDGVMLSTNNRLFTVRINSEHKIGSRIRVGENLTFTKQDGRNSGDRWLAAAVASPTITGTNDRTNPLAELTLIEDLQNNNNLQGRLYAEVDIIKGLTFRTVLGGYFFNQGREQWTPRYELAQRSNNTATLGISKTLSTKWQFDQILSYRRSFGAHNINALLGHSAEKLVSNSITASARDFEWESLRSISGGNPDFNSSSQGVGIKTNESYFANLNYDFADKYLLTASIRRDGSSRFGPNLRTGIFPAFSAGWKINEDFLKGNRYDWLDMLKLRVGYGFNGTEPSRDFQYETFLSTQNEVVYTLGRNERAIFGAAPLYNFGNPFLQWESTEMFNLGLDLTAFRSRLQFTAEYYVKTHNKLITALPLQAVYGLSGDAQPPLVNLGDIRNSGFEFNVIYKNYDKVFKWQVSANLTTNKNLVEYLPSGSVFSSGGTNVASVNHSIGSYYGFVAERILTNDDFAQEGGQLVQDEAGNYQPLVPVAQDLSAPGDIKFTDLNRDGQINAADRTIIGKVVPDFFYGLTVDLRYKLFDLNFLLQGVQNVDLYNQYRSRAGLAAGDAASKDESKLRMVQDYWTPENPVTDQTRIGLADYNDNARISTWWIEDASFLRLRNLQVGVTLPDGWLERLRMRNLRFFVGGENLFVITNYTGYDPEVANPNPNGDLVDSGTTPVPRLFITGLSIGF
jgi:TonB-linked SusC/RagA family outer membrane protein